MDYQNQPPPAPNAVAIVRQPNGRGPASNYPTSRYGFEGPGGDDDSSGSVLIEYWRTLRRHSLKIFIASILGLLIGFAVGVPMQPVYRAQTSLEVLTLNDDFMNMKQANPTTTNDGNYDTSEEQTQAKLLESSAVLDRVISKMDPHLSSLPPAKVRIATSGWRSILHLSEPVPISERQRLLSKAASTVKVKPTLHTRVMEVTVDSTDPTLAMDFANTLTQEFMAQSIEARWETTQRTSEWLRRELDDARDKLRHSEDALQTYARGSGLIFTDESTNVATEKLQQVQSALSSATTERIAHQSRYELAQNSPPDALADVLNDTSLRETQNKITDLKRQIAQLSTVFNPEYSKLKGLRAELDSLQSAFDHERSDILTRIQNDYLESTRKEKLLAAAYTAQAADVVGQDEKAIQYNILKRDVDSNRQLYDTMLQQMKQASIASAMRASNVRVVDRAKLPTSSFSPDFKLNSALGLLAGLLLSVAVITMRDRADRSLQEPGDIKLWADLPELGTIPSASLEGSTRYYAHSRPALEASPTMPAAEHHQSHSTRSSKADDSVELVTFQRKPSLIAEAFRSTLTSILFVGENGNRPRVLVFTSANAADGKTTVASNLAIAAAEIRCKVLIIDADLRRPRMHQIFNLPNDQGLTDYLQNDGSALELANLVRPTSVPNLDLLTAGPATHAASHLLYSPNFSAAIETFRQQYDMIMIDTPPMLQMTDARVAGRIADAVVLVARAGQTTRDAILAAKERLGEDRIRIMGTVLNDWNPRQSPSGYYGSYRFNYYGKDYSSRS